MAISCAYVVGLEVNPLLGHLQKQQVRQLLRACPERRRRIVAACLRAARKQVRQPVCLCVRARRQVIAQDVAVVPELLDDLV
ncbi:MAG: hypothetical protein HY587_08510 [Candidatus Omnitrophica bacterium]|nr:hypothetical protein [Candidatus Omnitrophota bacterium]